MRSMYKLAGLVFCSLMLFYHCPARPDCGVCQQDQDCFQEQRCLSGFCVPKGRQVSFCSLLEASLEASTEPLDAATGDGTQRPDVTPAPDPSKVEVDEPSKSEKAPLPEPLPEPLSEPLSEPMAEPLSGDGPPDTPDRQSAEPRTEPSRPDQVVEQMPELGPELGPESVRGCGPSKRTCAAGEGCCQGQCTPLNTNADCGACGTICGAVESCVAGLCKGTKCTQPPCESWAQSAVTGNTPGQATPQSAAVDSKGNVYLVGRFAYRVVAFGTTKLPNAGLYDAFVAKLDSKGQWLWAHAISSSEHDQGWGVAVDSKDNVYITGEYRKRGFFGSIILPAPPNNGVDLFVAKLDSSGKWLWAKGSGSSSAEGHDIAVDAKDQVYVYGNYREQAIFGSTILAAPQGANVFVAKLDSTGKWLWAKAPTSTGARIDYQGGLTVNAKGDAYITGVFNKATSFVSGSPLTLKGGDAPFIAKIDSGGKWLWAKAAGTQSGWGTDVAVDTKDNVYTVGLYRGGTGVFGTTTLKAAQGPVLFVTKLNSNGQWQWATTATTTSARAWGVAIDAKDQPCLSGPFDTSTTFGTHTIQPVGQSDVFIASLDATGKWLWAKNYGGTNLDASHGLTFHRGTGALYVFGVFFSSIKFGSVTLGPSLAQGELFVAKIIP